MDANEFSMNVLKNHNLCLQSVKSLVDEYGFKGVPDFMIHKSFHNEFMANVRRDFKEATGNRRFTLVRFLCLSERKLAYRCSYDIRRKILRN